MRKAGASSDQDIEAQYRQARSRARRRPAIWLRYRERQIVTRRPRPSNQELAELGAIRRELRIRSGGPR